ncbi:MAG: hypothetical protein ACAH59_10815 [Pseudobdellovibrionaceae bacterium]
MTVPIYHDYSYGPPSPDTESLDDWILALADADRELILKKIRNLCQGDWHSVIRMEDNIYELKINCQELIFLYFCVDREKNQLVFLKGMKVPQTQSTN